MHQGFGNKPSSVRTKVAAGIRHSLGSKGAHSAA
jgi:hypothetical protein